MKNKLLEPLVSILIANYNNKIYLKRCLNSCFNQKYKNLEIIIFDDCSLDGSQKELKKFKNIKIILNKKKTKIAYIDAMNAYIKMFKISKGDFVFLLDSDDTFFKKKIHTILNLYLKNINLNFIQESPKKVSCKKNNFFLSRWPYFASTSRLSFRRKFFEEFLSVKKNTSADFKEVWLDFRLCAYAFFKKKSFLSHSQYLTRYYTDLIGNQSKRYEKFSLTWFSRRYFSHLYLNCLMNNQKFNINLDFFLTKIIYKIITK